jgi:hypothetical protein
MNIELGEKLFSFATFTNWVNSAQNKFARAGVAGREVIALDQKGRICAWGTHFMAARDEDAFPVDVYRLRATKPSGETLKLEGE